MPGKYAAADDLAFRSEQAVVVKRQMVAEICKLAFQLRNEVWCSDAHGVSPPVWKKTRLDLAPIPFLETGLIPHGKIHSSRTD